MGVIKRKPQCLQKRSHPNPNANIERKPRYINIHMVVFFHCHLSFLFFLSKLMVFWSFQIFNKNVFIAPKASKPASWGSRLRCGQASRCPFLVVFGCVLICVDLHPSFLRRRIWGSLKFATPVIGTSLIVEKKCLQSGTLLAGKHVYIIGQRFDAWENWTAECAFLGRVQYRWAREEDSAAISQANTCMTKGKLYISYICIYIYIHTYIYFLVTRNL